MVGDNGGKISYFTRNGASLTKRITTEKLPKGISRINKFHPSAKKSSIMVSSGNEIRALDSNGKQFFAFDSNVAEPIKYAIAENGKYVYTCGEFLFNYYEILENSVDDYNRYNSPAEILDVFIHFLDGVSQYPILSCKDRGVRILNSECFLFKLSLSGAGNCMRLFIDSEQTLLDKQSLDRRFIFGQDDGVISCFQLNQFEGGCSNLWNIKPKGSNSPIVAIDLLRFTKGKYDDLIVARADSLVEVYRNMGNEVSPSFEIIGSIKIGESITNLKGAYFGAVDKIPEIIVTTFSGKIFGVKNNSLIEEDIELAVDNSAEQKEIKTMTDQIANLNAQYKKLLSTKQKKVVQNPVS